MTETRHQVQLSKQARKTLGKLGHPVQERILKALGLLRDYPRPPAARALVGYPGYLRILVGDYRVVYTVDDGTITVLVLLIGHRSVVYRHLPPP